MIIDLPDTTTGAVARKMVELREAGGAVALGRVMTLVIPTDEGPAEEAIRSSNDASREHPCRVITVVRGNKRGSSRLDAQIRVGGDAGASEVIVLRLYGPLADHGESVVVPFLLPDAPIVAWWPGPSPEVPVEDPLGRIAQRRITDASQNKNPIKALQQRAARHAAGDTDLAWTRITLWRGLLAAALDEPPYESVTSATVTGGSDSASTEVMAAWLSLFLDCPVKRVRTKPGSGMIAVRLDRESGPIEIVRPDGNVATLTQPGQPVRRIALPRRLDRDCLAEELRRLDPDDIFADVVTHGLPLLARTGSTATAKGDGLEQPPAPRRTPAAPPTPAVATPEQTSAGDEAAPAAAEDAERAGEHEGAAEPAPATEAAATKATARKTTARKTAARKTTAKKTTAKKTTAKKTTATKTTAKKTTATKTPAKKAATKGRA